jgi:hypothetical protein
VKLSLAGPRRRAPAPFPARRGPVRATVMRAAGWAKWTATPVPIGGPALERCKRRWRCGEH